jgi:hypothetical protein
MNESIIIQKMISIGQHLEREEIFYSGAEADARALLEEIKQALTIPDVVGQSEQLLAVAEYVYNHFDDSSSKTAKDYLQDFLRQ